MNVLHLDEQRGWRGGEQQASYLVAGLARRGHTVYLAGRRDAPFITRDHGADIAGRFAFPFRSEADIYTAWRIARVVRGERIDIIHAHTSHAHAAAVMARRFAGRSKVVVSRRVDFPPRANAPTRWKYDAVDGIIAISETIAGILREYGVDETRLHVVHSGIDPTRLEVPPIAREQLGVPEGVPLFGNVAALVGHKDHATLLRAFRRVLDSLPDARLVVAGEGALRGELEVQIAALDLGGAVQLLGNRSDVPAILHALDVFVMSSKEEGLGTSVLDAMAAGVPVAATAGGGIPESVRHEETGLLAPVGDDEALAAHMCRLYNDSSLATDCVDAARALIARQFTAETMVEGNIRVYERVLAG